MAAQQLRAALGEPDGIDDVIAALDDDAQRRLAELVDAARDAHARHIAEAVDEALSFLPGILRRQLRRMLV